MIRLDLSGLEKFLAELASRLEGPVLERVAEILREDVVRQFHTGGIPAWRPLSSRTVAAKRRAGYPRLTRKGVAPKSLHQVGVFGPGNVLMRTGALFSSWTNKRDPNHVQTLSPEGVSIGSSLVYARTHQMGRTFTAKPFGRGKPVSITVPARPIVVTDGALHRIAADIPRIALEGA